MYVRFTVAEHGLSLLSRQRKIQMYQRNYDVGERVTSSSYNSMKSALVTMAIYLRIEVHFFCLHWEIKGHWLSVNVVKGEALFKDLRATSVLSFPNANKKLYFVLK